MNVGNVLKYAERPDIPVQRAELVFADKMEYQVPLIMNASYEQDFQDFAAADYDNAQFNSTFVELQSAKPNPNKDANAYLVFADLEGHTLEKLQYGDTVRVTLDLPLPDEQTPEEPSVENDLLQQALMNVAIDESVHKSVQSEKEHNKSLGQPLGFGANAARAPILESDSNNEASVIEDIDQIEQERSKNATPDNDTHNIPEDSEPEDEDFFQQNRDEDFTNEDADRLEGIDNSNT